MLLIGALWPAFHFICSFGAGGCQRRGTVEAVAIQVFGSSFGRNRNAVDVKSPSRTIFARVLFAWAVQAHRRNLCKPRVTLCKSCVRIKPDSVQAGEGQSIGRSGNLWSLGTPIPIASVLAPVIGITIQPGPLAPGLVVPVVRVCQHLVALPAQASLTLAGWSGTEGLVGDLRAGYEDLATAGAVLGRHQISPYENSYGTRRPTLVAWHPVQKCWRLGTCPKTSSLVDKCRRNGTFLSRP